MATFYLCPISVILQYFTDVGVVLAGGKVNTYLAGTTTPTTTWSDITGTVPNSNPIILNSAGRLPNTLIWQASGVPIKVIITDANNNLIGPTFDQISGINDVAVTNSLLANPASGDGADLVANAMRSYDIFASARAANVPLLQAGQTLIVDFEGGVSIADGLGGLFYWNAASSAADDGLNVIKPTSLSGAGRYLRLNPYIEWFAVKSGQTARASNVIVAIDPDLQITLPQGGTYAIKGWLNDVGGTSAGGLKGQITYTGAISTGLWGMDGNGTAVTPVPLTNINTTQTLQTAQTGVGNMPIEGALLCTAGGTLSFSWAQNGSNVTGSVLGQGSYLRVTRLSSATGSFVPVFQNFFTTGPTSATIPVGASSVLIELFGSSGGGNSGSGAGCGKQFGAQGGSGGYARSTFNVAAANGQTISVLIGAAGTGAGGTGGLSSVTSGSFAIPSMTATGGGGATPTAFGTGGLAGSGAGGNTTNSVGNAGHNGDGVGGGGTGAGVVGINGNGQAGGTGGFGAGTNGSTGGPGLVVMKFT